MSDEERLSADDLQALVFMQRRLQEAQAAIEGLSAYLRAKYALGERDGVTPDGAIHRGTALLVGDAEGPGEVA